MKFTQRRIEELACPPGRKDVLNFDGHLGVRVTKAAQAGSLAGKCYLAQYSTAGAKRRVPLGSCDAISLAAAREATKAIMGDVAKGLDPAAKRKEAVHKAKEKAEREALTFGVLIDRWEKLHLSGRRPGYAIEATRALRFAFAKHLKESAAALDSKTVRKKIGAIADEGKKATARLTKAYGRACYGWAIGKDLVSANPFEGVRAEVCALSGPRFDRRRVARRLARNRGTRRLRPRRSGLAPDRCASRRSRRDDVA